MLNNSWTSTKHKTIELIDRKCKQKVFPWYNDQVLPSNLLPGNLLPGNLLPGDLLPGNLLPGNLSPGDLSPLQVSPGDLSPLHCVARQFVAVPDCRYGKMLPRLECRPLI
jgi:hypothetical protein